MEKTIENAIDELKLFIVDKFGPILEETIKKCIEEVLDEREKNEKFPRYGKCEDGLRQLSEEYKEYLYLRLKTTVLAVLKSINDGERFANEHAIHEYIATENDERRAKYKEMFSWTKSDKPMYELFCSIDDIRPKLEKLIDEYKVSDEDQRKEIRKAVESQQIGVDLNPVFDLMDIRKENLKSSTPSLAAVAISRYVNTKIEDVLDKSMTTDDVSGELDDTIKRMEEIRSKSIDKYIEVK